MTRSNKTSQVINNTKIKSDVNNKQRLGTLKLWQKHIEALSKPSSETCIEPMEQQHDEELDAFLDTQMNILKPNRNTR